MCPGGAGIWPAIWMLPVDNAYGAWPASGELDIVEQVSLVPWTQPCIVSALTHVCH